MIDNYVGCSAKTDTNILLTWTYPPPTQQSSKTIWHNNFVKTSKFW